MTTTNDKLAAVTIRELNTWAEYREVFELERVVWGFTDVADVVTPVVFMITVKTGALLLGAFDAEQRLVGFCYAIVGMRDGKAIQWSHMTGVLPEYRGGLGWRLKLEQRTRVMARGYDLVAWTFDPLQAMNAHLNVSRLGAVANEYHRNVYGESTSTLHRGTPTDRLVAQWHIREPHVVRRLEQARQLTAKSHDVGEAPVVNPTMVAGDWRVCSGVDLALEARRLWVEIPGDFTEMQRDAPELALAWRMHTRAIFETYFARGYRAVDFVLSREERRGRYLLAREE